MKVILFIGSARKKHTYKAAYQFAEELEKSGDISCELIRLSEYNISYCHGCIQCFEKGEENCPYAEDIGLLLDKMDSADGVVFATPNYGFHMSGLMKTFIDRCSFNFHRPRYFGKVASSIVTQGFYKGNDILNYFKFITNALGFKPIKGVCLTTLEPMPKKQDLKNQAKIKKLSNIFIKELKRNQLKAPTLFGLMIFRMSRVRVKKLLTAENRDYTYYTEKGWFESDFYYPVKLNPVMKLFGKLFDWLAEKTT